MSPTTTAGIAIEVLLGPDEWARSLRADAAAGLTATPKELPPTWLYDDRGCELFDEITRLPEYYPTRAERAVLEARAATVASMVEPTMLVELGAGTAEKTRVLLDALVEQGCIERYVPFDVAAGTLLDTAAAIASEHPGIDVHGVVGDFRRHLGGIPAGGRRLIAFLGGTIGNLRPPDRASLLADLAGAMAPGDALLVGTDLVKDRGRLVAAYDDAAGVTAEFERNVLRVLNRELGADFDVDAFAYRARFDEEHRWVEMVLVAERAMVVEIPGLQLTVAFRAGEALTTEISAKFDPDQVAAELTVAGLERTAWWTDPDGDYALTLAAKP